MLLKDIEDIGTTAYTEGLVLRATGYNYEMSTLYGTEIFNDLNWISALDEDASPQLSADLDGQSAYDLINFVDGTFSGTLAAGTLTDGTLSIASGSITSGVNATFSDTVTAEQITSTDNINASGNIIALNAYLGNLLYIRDGGSGHYLKVSSSAGVSGANRNLTIRVGASDRILTISGNATISQDYSASGSPTLTDLTLSAPSNIYALSHDSFADFVANEHIDWTSASDNFSTSGTLDAGAITGTSFIVGGNTLDTNEWAVLDGVTASMVLDWTSASVGTIDATNIEDKFLRNDGDDVTSGAITIGGSTGVKLSGGSGILALAGVGGSNNGALRFDFEGTANQVIIVGDLGVNRVFWGINSGYRDSFYNLYGTDDDWGIGFEGGRSNLLNFVYDPLGTPATALSIDTSGNFDFQSGTVIIGNKLIFTQSDGNEYIDSLADGYLDYSVTTAHRFNMSTADTDVRMEFVGTTNSGVLTWMEDEDYFSFADTIKTSGKQMATVAKSGAYTLTQQDEFVACDASGGAFTITLPAVSAVNAGQTYNIKKIDVSANAVTVDGNGAETIDDAATAVITTQYENITIVSDDSEWWVI